MRSGAGGSRKRGGIGTCTEPSDQTISEADSARGPPMVPSEVNGTGGGNHFYAGASSGGNHQANNREGGGRSNRATGGTPSDNSHSIT